MDFLLKDKSPYTIIMNSKEKKKQYDANRRILIGDKLNEKSRESYKINQEKELNRKKIYRDNLSDEKKEKAKAYQKLYREKKRAESKKILP